MKYYRLYILRKAMRINEGNDNSTITNEVAKPKRIVYTGAKVD